MSNTWKNILRWIAVLPVVIAGIAVGVIGMTLLGHLQAWFMGMNPDSGYVKVMSYIFGSLVAGALGVFWGAKTAPSYRKIIGAIITGLILILAIVVLGISISYGQDGWFWPLFSSLSLVIGAGYVMHQIYEEGEDFDLFK